MCSVPASLNSNFFFSQDQRVTVSGSALRDHLDHVRDGERHYGGEVRADAEVEVEGGDALVREPSPMPGLHRDPDLEQHGERVV